MNRVLIYLVLSDAVTSESGEPVRRYLLVLLVVLLLYSTIPVAYRLDEIQIRMYSTYYR